LQIATKDAADSIAETSVPYRVYQRSGGASIAVSPRSSNVAVGNNVSLNIKMKNTQSIDDTFKIRISVVNFLLLIRQTFSVCTFEANIL
jgi:hypothetical protein